MSDTAVANTKQSINSSKLNGFEPWMLTNVASGAMQMSFLLLLVQPFITDLTSSATKAGLMFAVIKLTELLSPTLGRFADTYLAHKPLYTLSFVGMFIGFAILALDTSHDTFHPLVAILLGLTIAAQGTINSALVVGSGLPREQEIRQLTLTNILFIPVGQMTGGIIVIILQALGLDYSLQFWIVAILMLLTAIMSWFTLDLPVQRLKTTLETKSPTNTQSSPSGTTEKYSLKTILLSKFGIFLLALMFFTLSSYTFISQIANIMPKVFGFTVSATSVLVSLGGLVSLFGLIAAGIWMKRSDAISVYFGATVFRVIALTGVAVVAILSGSIAMLLSVVFLQLLYLSQAVGKSPTPPVTMHFSPVPPGETNGYIYAAYGLGGFFGSLGIGILADQFGFSTALWFGAITASISLIILVIFVLPAWKRTTPALSKAGSAEKSS